jgi:hypothetical protein
MARAIGASPRIVAALVVLAACSKSAREPAASSAESSVSTPPPATSSSSSPSQPSALTAIVEADRSSSALALGSVASTRVAVLADEDDATLRVLALPDAAPVASVKLAGTPGHLVVDGAGVVWVAIRDADVVQGFTLACAQALPAPQRCSLVETGRFATSPEPVALALSSDPTSLFVVSSWGRELTRHALPSGEPTARAPLAREPRAVLASKNGDLLVIAHASGSVITTAAIGHVPSALPTREMRLDYRDHVFEEGMTAPVSDEPRYAGQGFALARVGGHVLAPMVVAYPGDPEPAPAYGTVADGYFPHEVAVAQMEDPPTDAAPRLRVRATVVAADKNRVSFQRVAWPPESPPCLLPRAAAPDAAKRSMLVACMGIDQVVEVDGAERPLVDSFLRRWRVPAGPVAIAVDAERDEAWVWSIFDRKLSRIELSSSTPAVLRDADASTAIPADTPLAADWSAGRRLFHTPLAFDGRACASCHPDARNDGLTWTSPAGPLQTPMLAARLADTAPYGWLGDSPTLPKHLGQTMQRLRARALTEPETSTLATYITHAKTFLAPRVATPEEERGRAIFESTEAGCQRCHQAGGRKSDGWRHDVGTGGSFETPSLRFVGGTAPYGHDGRYATLRELLVKTEGKMGSTRALREPDLLALIAYLRSL